MALKDIIGQEKALYILKGCVLKNRIPHALFFAGDEGIGKCLTAINFAKALNCKKNRNASWVMGSDLKNDAHYELHITDHEIDACDECTSCAKTDKGNHPDVFIIGPEGDGDQITVSAVRKLEESLSYKPFEGNWKVAIIDNADKLNQSRRTDFSKHFNTHFFQA